MMPMPGEEAEFTKVIATDSKYLRRALPPYASVLSDISTEEAARTLGRNTFDVMRTVTLPMIRPGLLAGAGLVFLTAMKELPATLLLGPTGFSTMATQIWDTTEEAFFARASVPALLLVLVSAVAVWLILSQEEKKAR